MPSEAGNLFVPSIVDVGVLGSDNNSDGSCISPPPPAIESTKPAKVDAITKKSKTSNETSTISIDSKYVL